MVALAPSSPNVCAATAGEIAWARQPQHRDPATVTFTDTKVKKAARSVHLPASPADSACAWHLCVHLVHVGLLGRAKAAFSPLPASDGSIKAGVCRPALMWRCGVPLHAGRHRRGDPLGWLHVQLY